MIVEFQIDSGGDGYCTLRRQDADPRAKNESHLLYQLKNYLNKHREPVLSPQHNPSFIKKRMWKDGHLVSEYQQYLRERKKSAGIMLAIWNPTFAIRGAEEDYNNFRPVKLLVTNLIEEG